MKNEIITKAVDWWVSQITHGAKFDAGSDKNDQALGMAELMASILAAGKRKSVDKEKIKNFAKDLYNLIEDRLKQVGRCTLSTDYAPDYPLSEVINKNQLDPGLFPWKTTMWIDENEVVLKNGYGADQVKL